MRKYLLAGAIYLASIGLLGGCSRTTTIEIGESKFRCSKQAANMYNRIMEYRDQHGLTRCKEQEGISILEAAASQDGDPSNRTEAKDILPQYKKMLCDMEARYGRTLAVDGLSNKTLKIDD